MAYQKIKPCETCGAAIRFIRMKRSGRLMPVNAEPVEVTPCIGLDRGGHVFITLEGETVRARKKKEDSLFYDGVDSIAVYELHKCNVSPDGDGHRKHRRKK